MNREFDKEKDLHDGVCLTLFILCLLGVFIFYSRRSFVMDDPLPEQIVVDGTEEVVPTFDPNHETVTVLPSISKTSVTKVSYTAPKKETEVYDCTKDVLELEEWIHKLLSLIKGSNHSELLAIYHQLEGYLIELSAMNLNESRIQDIKVNIGEIEKKISELQSSILSQVLISISSFTIYSTKDYQTKVAELISYLPDGTIKDEFLSSLHQFDVVIVSNVDEFISVASSELVLEIQLQEDILIPNSLTLALSKKIDGEGHSFGGTKIVVSNTTVAFSNLNLFENTEILVENSSVSFENIHNDYESFNTPSVIGFNSTLTGDIQMFLYDDSIHGYFEEYCDTIHVHSFDEFLLALQNPFIVHIVLECDLYFSTDVIVSRSITIDVNGYSIDECGYQIQGDITWIGVDDFFEEDMPIENDEDVSSIEEDLFVEESLPDNENMIEDNANDSVTEESTLLGSENFDC